MRFEHPQFDESVNVTPVNPLAEFARYLFAVLLLMVAIYYGSFLLVNAVVPYISKDKEQWLWDKAFKHFVDEGEIPNTKENTTARQLNDLMTRIPKEGLPDFIYRTYFQHKEDVNAYALPAGNIVVYEGLYKKLHSENALVFVLGHELGHFANRDHLRGLGRALLVALIISPFVADDALMTLFEGADSAMTMHFSQEQELAADAYGLKALVAVYGHAGGATELFEMLKKEENGIELLYASTHPLSRERIEHIDTLIKEQGLAVRATVPLKNAQ